MNIKKIDNKSRLKFIEEFVHGNYNEKLIQKNIQIY